MISLQIIQLSSMLKKMSIDLWKFFVNVTIRYLKFSMISMIKVFILVTLNFK